MLRPTVLALLLACAVSLGSSAVILDNGMPIMWASAADQVTNLPIDNGVVAPNPWDFLHRMSFYRLMIAATDPFMGSMGTNATDSPLWGLPLQLAWMKTSGMSPFLQKWMKSVTSDSWLHVPQLTRGTCSTLCSLKPNQCASQQQQLRHNLMHNVLIL